jgi:Fe-Mn family superoxide dismutase
MENYTPEELNIKTDLDGLSLKLVQDHFKLYEGYVKKSNEVQGKIKEADKSEANQSYSYIGELKRQETFAVNGMKLHEVYFRNLGGDGKEKGILLDMINEDFGSFEAWKEDMVATGIAARGWAILCFDFKDMKLHNYGSDAHNIGAVWGAEPLIALDVYEHAYMLDYSIDRKSYIDAFFKNLDWDFANERIERIGITKHRQEKSA